MMKSVYEATVLITTKNRCEELRVAMHSVRLQSASCELIVIDDGSTDGTQELIRNQFPEVRYIRHTDSMGYIVRRNEGVSVANSPVVFSIDDDAYFQSANTVEQTLTEFSDSRIGAVAIPFIDVNKNSTVRQIAPFKNKCFISSAFIGTAHAIRKDVFLHVGGYRPYYFHQGEEGDFCIRMLQSGYFVRLGSADPIHHTESPKRDLTRMDVYGRRNDILFNWYNTPSRFLPSRLLATTLNGLHHGIVSGRFRNAIRGLATGVVAIPGAWKHRSPVAVSVYSLFRSLKRNGPITLESAVHNLPFLPNVIE